MYKPLPLHRRHPRRLAWAGNLLAVVLAVAGVWLVDRLPDLAAGVLAAVAGLLF